jgi:hypothetical protein
MFQQLSSRFLVFIPFRLPRAPFGLDTQTAIDTLNMSKIKSSPDKKRISLKKDRRNVYGENPASSRKNIREGKQRSHRELRRAAGESLRQVIGTGEESDAGDQAESQAKDRILLLARSSFKKVPDAPLGVVVDRKLKRRNDNSKGRKSR